MNEDKAPFLSIVVLCYRVAGYLPECLESIRNQTFRDYEVIMVDDGSPDGCGAICDFYAAMDSRFRAIHKKNGGIVAARKTALRAAGGLWCGSVDGDDWIDPQMYEKMCGVIRERGVDFAQCAEYLCYRNNKVCDPVGFPTEIFYGEAYADYLREMMKKGNRRLEVSLCRVILRTDTLRDILEQMDNRCALCEDAACLFIYASHASSMCTVEEPLYCYRMREHSCTKTVAQRNEKWLYWLFDYVERETADSPVQEPLLKWLAIYFLKHCTFTFYMQGPLMEEQERNRYLKEATASKGFQHLVSFLKIQEYPLYFSKTVIQCLLFGKYNPSWIAEIAADTNENILYP